MPLLADFDPAHHSKIPNLDFASFITLGRQVLAAAPKRQTKALKTSLAELTEIVGEAAAAYDEHLDGAGTRDGRPIDQAADNSWGCLYRRLDDYAALPHGHYENARRAAALKEKIFPTGLLFLKLEHGAQWTEAELRVKRIKDQKLKPALDELTGSPDFYAEVLRCHAQYAEMVGVTRPKTPRKQLPDLRAVRLRLQQALTAHAIQLVAMVLTGGKTALAAAKPSFDAIDEYRDKATPEKKKPDEPGPGPSGDPSPR